jgi:hypothetical protein
VQNLRVRVLGDLQVEGCDPARLGRRQVRRLLKVLALYHDRPVGLDRLVDCLWGDDPPARPADQLSVLASRLRGYSVLIGFDATMPVTRWRLTGSISTRSGSTRNRPIAGWPQLRSEPPERQPQPGSRWSGDRCSPTNPTPGGPSRNARPPV